ncbi:MAG: MCP four helix bundle domain-containing protein, partial [Sterolibacterium sp.]
MKIWHKIMVAPAVAIAFLALLGAVSYGFLTRQHEALEDLYGNRIGSYRFAADSAQAISEVHSNVYRLFTWVANLKEDKIKQITSEQDARIDALSKSMAQFVARPDLSAKERSLAEEISKKLRKYRQDMDTAIDLSTVDISTGISAMQTADDSFQAMLKDFRLLVQFETQLAQENYDGALSAYAKVVVALISILALALAVSVVAALWMSRMITRPLVKAVSVAKTVAAGDLTSHIEVTSKDETGELLQALKHMNASLLKIVGEVRSGTEAIGSGTAEIARG